MSLGYRHKTQCHLSKPSICLFFFLILLWEHNAVRKPRRKSLQATAIAFWKGYFSFQAWLSVAFYLMQDHKNGLSVGGLFVALPNLCPMGIVQLSLLEHQAGASCIVLTLYISAALLCTCSVCSCTRLMTLEPAGCNLHTGFSQSTWAQCLWWNVICLLKGHVQFRMEPGLRVPLL